MQLPLQVVFRNIEPSAAVSARIRARAEELEKYYDRIMGCRVVVEQHRRRRRQGKLFQVRIDLTVPDAELVVSRDPGEQQTHEDVYVAIRDAFNAVRRQLEDYVRHRRGDVKQHASAPQKPAVDLTPSADYG